MEQIFEEWNAYAQKKELQDRELSFEKLIANARLKIVVITGMRRCGKTSILILLSQRLSRKGKKTGYINLEDSRIKNRPEVLDDILKWFGEEGCLLLDEITNARDWEGWLARNHEMLKGRLNLILSSSRRGLAVPSKPLRGRMLAYELYPLSFREYLCFKKIKLEKTTVGLGRMEKALEEYLVYGGFPEVVLLADKTEKIRLLNFYFRDIIGLDIAEIARENISTVELFGKYVIDAPYFSASKCLSFFKSQGYGIAKQSLLYLEKCSQEGYLFFFAPIFSYTIKDRSQYPRKSYLGDTGFIYALSGKKDWGRLYENAVFLHLKRQNLPATEINYWKNAVGREADFVLREGLKTKEIIQVAYELSEEKTKDREVSGLVECARALGLKKGKVITKNLEKSKTVDGITIQFIPLWKWLL
ncbi:MAG: ATP-binding protein [Nanoarchaeota archaeon]